MRPYMVLVRGIPGSGKSTLARALTALPALNAVHVEADMFFTDADGRYEFRLRDLTAAHEWCLGVARDAIGMRRNVVVCNVFATRRDLQPYIDVARRHDAQLFVVEALTVSPDIHGVPEATLQRMCAAWEPLDALKEYHNGRETVVPVLPPALEVPK